MIVPANSSYGGALLLKAFANKRAQGFSDENWLHFIHQGGSMTGFEYCEDSEKFFTSEQFKDTLVE